MDEDVRGMAARFVAQRMELGEDEWGVDPRMPVNRSAATAQAMVHADSAAGGQVDDGGGIPSHITVESCSGSKGEEDALAVNGSLDELYEAVCGCQRCSLGGLRTKFVFGTGDPDAGIMFIGEAPGADEDAQGIPFVGRAGKLLTRMIEGMKLTRDEVYIGNILKCRPPGNRDPKPGEIELCEPILLRQIEIIRPRVMCALGRIAGQTLLRTKATLGSLRGKMHDYHGVKLMVTYHPAALLRNANFKPAAWEDLKMLRREFDGMEL